MLPTVFGRYQLLEPIAKGGMAEVFKAKAAAAAGTEKLLCIKRILPHLSQNSDFMQLFISEAKIALPLSHGNITQVFDFGEVDGVYYLAMEYIRGQNLHAVISRLRSLGKTLDIDAGLFIATEVCKGVHYAHTYTDPNGKPIVVVHRDISPHNVLISYTGQVKLTDFGIALAATKATSDDGPVRGKPCYLSPEQASGSPSDPRSDIFSLGAVLYEMLTGQRCFEGEGDAETLARVRVAEVVPPSKHKPEIGSEIDAVVLKALSRDPAQRFQRAGDLQVALAGLLHARAPDYTAERLSARMKALFAAEQGEAEGDNQRDRLLMQLAQAGVEVDAKDAGTGELLEMRTVAIESAGSDEPPPRWRRWIGLAAAIVAGVAVFVSLFAVTTAKNKHRASPEPAARTVQRPPPKIGETDHLTTPSMKKEQPPTVEPLPKRSQPRRLNKPRKVAYLNCNSWPWSVVYLNGRRLRGNTPIYSVKVAAGKHRLKFVNPELGLSKEVTISVDPNETKTVAVSLQ